MARAPAAFHEALDKHWRAVAGRFGHRASIVDLACGNGTVARRLSAARPDLSIIGVDFAQLAGTIHLTGAVQAVEIRGRVAIENLPFDRQSFDGAVSQFGLEYCDVERGVAEVARVLRPGARLALIVHHAHSPIVLDNIRSDCALRRLLGARMKRAFLGGNQPSVKAIIAALPASARIDPTIQLLASALVDRAAWPAAERAKSLAAVADAMRPEIALSAALSRSAVDPAHLDRWLSPFAALFDHIVARPFDVRGQTMAWTIEARRAG